MAKGKRILALDVGTSSVKLAEFNLDKNGQLVLQKCGITSLGLDPHNEDERSAYVESSVGELLAEYDIAPGPALVSVPGQSVFSRYVKLPPVEHDKIYQIVQYEAAQNVPFPMDEVVWDYQLLESSGDELDVLLVAMKQDIVDEIALSVSAAGLDTDLVDVAPMAVYNTYRQGYGRSDECVLLLDVGARSTDLIFVEGGQVFNRSIPVAGNAITQQIMKEFGFSFDDAEALKLEKAFVSFGGAYESPEDEIADKISKCVRTVMTRMHAEINRSINFYRGQQAGSPPVKLLLTGGSSVIPYLDQFLSDKLKIEVEHLNPSLAVEISDEIDAEQLESQLHMLSEVIGLGLRGAGDCAMELNLMPPEIVKKKRFRKKQPAFVAAAALLVLGVYSLVGYHVLQNGKKTTYLSEISSEISALDGVASQVNRLQATLNSITSEIDTIDEINSRRGNWSAIVNEIGRVIPEGMWITSIAPLKLEADPASEKRSRPGIPPASKAAEGVDKIRIEGLGYMDKIGFQSGSYSHISALVDRLRASDLFSDETKLDLSPTPQQNAFYRSFLITLVLEEPVAL